jgi:hemoglobin-like flavoprotein
MIRSHIDLLQRSFDLVELQADRARVLFVARLAESDPSLAGRLRHDPVAALGALVAQLDDVHEVVRSVQRLADDHLAAGGSPGDPATVRIALLWALEQLLGSAYTADVRNAWAGLTRTVVTVMAGADERDRHDAGAGVA